MLTISLCGEDEDLHTSYKTLPASRRHFILSCSIGISSSVVLLKTCLKTSSLNSSSFCQKSEDVIGISEWESVLAAACRGDIQRANPHQEHAGEQQPDSNIQSISCPCIRWQNVPLHLFLTKRKSSTNPL